MLRGGLGSDYVETLFEVFNGRLSDAEAGDLVLRLVSAVGSGGEPSDLGSIGGP